MRTATMPVTTDPATRFVHLAGWYLTIGQPKRAIRAYRVAACYAHGDDGARELIRLAAELEFGLLTAGTVH